MAFFLMGRVFKKPDASEEEYKEEYEEDTPINLSIPRRPYIAEQLEDPEVCPECGAGLMITQFCSYLSFVGDLKKPDMVVLGSDAGSFCPDCPAVVLDMKQFANEALEDNQQDVNLSIVGIIDWNGEATEKDVQIMQFDSDDEEPFRVITFLESKKTPPLKTLTK